MSTISSTSPLTSLLNSGRLTVNGLATGLDTDKIIQGLQAIDQARIDQLQAKQATIQARQTAFKGVEARILALQNSLAQLARPQSNVFTIRNVSSSNESLLSAAATSSAVAGTYTLRVNALAKAQQIASQGFDSPTSNITQGTLDIRVGAGAAATITIDANNNTLQSLAAAINNADIGVNAVVVSDGSASSTQPYRLLLTAAHTGAANTISITNNLVADSGGAVRPVLDNTFLGAANADPGYTGTAAVASNRGAGAFTGSTNNTYRFTVLTSGTVGTDDNLQVAYTDASGAHSGTVTINAADVDTFQAVAEGIQVKFAAGTLVARETFSIDGFVPSVQQAADASVTLGSGAGALTVQSASNQIDGLFPGVTVDLHAADPSQTVTLTVANDVEKAASSIHDFVSAFNDLMKFIDDQVHFDAATGTAGALLGNQQVIALQDQARRIVLDPVAGLKAQMNRLSALGISTNDGGQLVVDDAKLKDALAGNLAGVTLDDVRRLFTVAGSTSLSSIQFVSASSKTAPSPTPYQVVVTQAARQAFIEATNAVAASTVLTSANNSFDISIDGALSNTISLAPGTYTRAALAQALEAQINADSRLAGRKVAVGLDGDHLTITSNSYGAVSAVAIGAGSALAALGFAGTETNQGQDVAGHFVVNGQVESATGSGQFLLGVSTNAHTADLQVRVLLTPSQVSGEVTSDLTMTRGVASSLDATLTSLLDPVNGRLKTVDDTFEAAVNDITKEIQRQSDLMAQRRDSLLQQFAALERTVSQLQGLGNFLTAQFAQINNLNNSRR